MPPADLARAGLLGQHLDLLDRELDFDTGQLTLAYAVDGLRMVERLRLPVAAAPRSASHAQAVAAALDLLHWVAALSYWKLSCPAVWRFAQRRPDPWQAEWLTTLLRQGMAEFAWHHQLDVDEFGAVPGAGQRGPACLDSHVDEAFCLLPLGGGKDSLLAWHRLQGRVGRLVTVQVGSAQRIQAVAADLHAQAGGEHWVIERQLDPALAQLNERGAYNGHVPITAINAAVMTLLAVWHGAGLVVFANERSADEATLHDVQGRPVNHQYAKSFAFEQAFDAWVRHHIDPQLRVFSLLRRDRELAVCQAFAALPQLHGAFSSCNRNFHLTGSRTQRWCGQCPKCHFVFLALAPFMTPTDLTALFGDNLLARADQLPGFVALLGLDDRKPFECVGEAQEARAAARALAAQPAWATQPVVQALNACLAGCSVPSVQALCQPSGAHLIPERFLHAAA